MKFRFFKYLKFKSEKLFKFSFKFKGDGGISMMEIILAMGIMSMLTPVVIKLAFKDIGDIKYLNIAKQLKQFTKSLSAYAASKREDWHNNASGQILVSDLSTFGLEQVISEDLLKNSAIKYIKDKEGKVFVYAVIKMNFFGLDMANFSKVLQYVEDNIGYAVSERCGTCTSTVCVCSINNDWSIGFRDVLVNNVFTYKDGDNYAVLKIDDTLLEKEYVSNLFLYRNAQGGVNGNVMGRDLSLGFNSIKNIKDIFASSLMGKEENSAVLKVTGGTVDLYDKVNVINSVIFDKASNIEFGSMSSIFSPEIYFKKLLEVGKFSIPSANISKTALIGETEPKLEVRDKTSFNKLKLQNLITETLDNSAVTINDGKIATNTKNPSVDTSLSTSLIQIASDVPGKELKLTTKILNVAEKFSMDSVTCSSNISGGILFFQENGCEALDVKIGNIKGRKREIDTFSFLLSTEEDFKSIDRLIKNKFCFDENGIFKNSCNVD